MSRANKNKSGLIIICLILAVGIIAGTFLGFRPFYYNNIYMAPVPQNLSTAAAGTHEYIYGDFYVSPDGNDNAAGTAEFPFATIDRAKKAAKQLDRSYRNHIVIALMEGVYELDELKFTENDSGKEKCRMIFSAYGNGEVIFSGTDVIFDGAQYVTLSNITVSGGKITVNAENIDISGCTVKNSPDIGISAKGSNINIIGCTIYKTGSSAVTLNGGNTKKLTAGNIVFENSLVYDTSMSDSSHPAVVISGVGNVCANNEILHTPGCAVYYSGNNHRIDYNYIHNVLLAFDDMAAVESPDGWVNYGNLVRYNCISTIGSGKNSPVAVAPASGTQVRGNIFINIPGTGVDFRGGRDIELSNNLLINCKTPIFYESITIKGERFGQNGTAWQELENSPRMSDKWKEAYPQVASLSDDFSDTSSPYFAANPTGSVIEDNIILHAKASIGTVDEKASKMSHTANNHLLKLTQTDMFTDAKNGDYTIDFEHEGAKTFENFLNIPFDSIGRY
ncbi:MAG: right-handed parallel beta-helix repeat-containing protein [Clostridia bacterium]|nr:right-handed parallel beta-helix repeat-containing protein [Clostridia bacterium]